jgi:hypothetical protein
MCRTHYDKSGAVRVVLLLLDWRRGIGHSRPELQTGDAVSDILDPNFRLVTRYRTFQTRTSAWRSGIGHSRPELQTGDAVSDILDPNFRLATQNRTF